jgi:hypothetical protein
MNLKNQVLRTYRTAPNESLWCVLLVLQLLATMPGCKPKSPSRTITETELLPGSGMNLIKF